MPGALVRIRLGQSSVTGPRATLRSVRRAAAADMGMQRLAIAAVHGANRLGAGGVNGAAGLIAPQQVQNCRLPDDG